MINSAIFLHFFYLCTYHGKNNCNASNGSMGDQELSIDCRSAKQA